MCKSTEEIYEFLNLSPGKWDIPLLETTIVDGENRKRVPDRDIFPLSVRAVNEEDEADYMDLCLVGHRSFSISQKADFRLFSKSKQLLLHTIMVKLWFEDQGIGNGDIFFSKDLIEQSTDKTWEEIRQFING